MAAAMAKAIPVFDFAALLRARDHAQCGSVLDGACRVVAFEFAQHHIAVFHAGLCPNALQAHQGCFSNGVFNGGIVHGLKCAII
jgi:hypothetical protein